MSIEQLKNNLPDYAKDIKLNLSMVLSEEGTPDLTREQRNNIMLAAAYATKNPLLIKSLLAELGQTVSEIEINTAKAATTIMSMNNIYYRFIHISSDKSFSTLPAKLRMNVIANPGISKINFELSCLAISALNGCGMCIDAHANHLITAGVTRLGIQSVIRIAAVFNAVAVALEINALG